MRLVQLKAASLALILLGVATLARAGVDVRAVSETNGKIVVQLDNHLPPNYGPAVSFYVAIAPTGTFSASYFVGPATSAGAALAAPVAADTIRTSTPFQFRTSRLVWVYVLIPSNTPVSHVVINFTPAAIVADAAHVDPLVRALVVNQHVFPVQPASGAPVAWFNRAAGWARFAVSARGMYSVTGSDLAAEGISLASIDPSSLRLVESTLGIQP
ncbi:MAG TPA: hypothetical protein VFH88_02565, partial [Candidatus Krumholzibacteria bacterium]|nr:hypothetical protein [Candidatus Krumholzibacteria bacterium]